MFITPDNGTLTHIAKFFGLKAVRKINETTSRLPHSDESHTFHGRDVYAYNGARLASGQLDFSDIGPKIDPATIVKLPPVVTADSITGMVDILDVRFGSKKKRTWYTQQPFKASDWFVVILAIALFGITLYLFKLNHGRFYDPFN